MPTDIALVSELVHAIGGLTNKLPYNGTSLSNVDRAELARSAERLATAVREPAENLYFQATQTAQNSAIRTAINMGVFERIPPSGSGIHVTDLAVELDVDSCLLVRIMRALTCAHLFHEVSPSHYTHNTFSSIFLTPANRDMFKQMYDYTGLGVYMMPQYLESTQYQNPTDYNNGAFQYAHRTILGFFEYLKEDPERLKVYNSGMQSLATIGDGRLTAGAFPFDREIVQEEISDKDVMIVDVGGGRGQALMNIKACFPTLKGRMILQDVHSVIDDAQTAGLPSFIEPMAASFFEPQPIKGAIIYHFRRIFHDWSDEVSLRILSNTVQAMDYRSRVLITDTVVPEMGAPRHIAMQDIYMMSFGGMERTQLQWESLLEKAGLSIKRLWTREGNLQNTIEAVISS